MIRSIQALRFVAALSVAAFHLSFTYFGINAGAGPFQFFLAPFHKVGFAGVDVFFVISGFVIWHTTREAHGRHDIAPFAAKRAARIYLGYWPWLAAMALIRFGLEGRPPDQYDVIRSIWLLPQAHSSVLPLSWTLTFELMFYLGFAASMMLPRRISLFALIAWGCLALCISAKTMLLNPYVAEFAAGVGLASAAERYRVPSLWVGLSIAVVGLIAGLTLYEKGHFLLRVLTFGTMGVGLVLACLSLEARRIRLPNLLVEFGNASYTLYLCHMPIFRVFRHFPRAMKSYPDFMCAAMLLIALLVALLWYRFVERPIYRNACGGIEGGRERVCAQRARAVDGPHSSNAVDGPHSSNAVDGPHSSNEVLGKHAEARLHVARTVVQTHQHEA